MNTDQTVVVPKMSWEEFSGRYCKTQESTPEELAGILRGQIARYSPKGFFLAEAQLLDSSWLGSVVILPFGPSNTFKDIPDTPFSPRGLASDTSMAIGYIDVESVPAAGVVS